MILCHCNVISKSRVQKAIREITTSAPDTLITPGRVYKQIGCRAKCGKCACHFSREIKTAQMNDASDMVSTEVTAIYKIAAE